MNLYRSHQKALRFIASIHLIQRRVKCLSREEKSAFTQCFFRIYVRSLKDQARQSKYPRTQILDPRAQSKLICHSSTTFLPTRSINLIQVTSQSYIGIDPNLYSFLRHPIQLYPRTHITIMRPLRKPTSSLLIPSSLENRGLQAEEESASCEDMALRKGLLITKRLSSRQPSNGEWIVELY